MHIHEVIIDGFKSYATKTIVSGFDPHFNAITGLNGTGKSNILDAICFVLGISVLSQVRVGNLQELIYKQGQAGVTKATVTVIFNNADPLGSPVGYETSKEIIVSRQIAIGGKNKYIINGKTVQQKQVQNLFHSVQLNVNNPHFLIMQGRITKVLNMKPPEILSMIEEAAGTRMFETKKQDALKTLEKKQHKVDELTRVMDEQINPSLGSLREEREQYAEFQGKSRELERLERLCVAFEFTTLQGEVESAEQTKSDKAAKLRELESLQAKKMSESEAFSAQAEKLKQELKSEQGGSLDELKTRADDVSMELVKADTHMKNQKECLAGDRSQQATLDKQIRSASETLVEKKAELAQVAAQFSVKEAELASADAEMVKQRERYQNALAGIADESSTDLLSIPEQIGAWEKRERETASQLQQTSLRLEHSKRMISEKKKFTSSEKAEYEGAMAEVDRLRGAAADAERVCREMSAQVVSDAELRKGLSDLKSKRTSLRDTVDALTAQLEARLNFEFKDPVKGFDRSKVRGMVARLVQLPEARAATALEITAGGKLFQVVVDSEQTGKLLLNDGQLKKRVTILPLNKLSARCVDGVKVGLAKATASKMGGTANLAIELVGFQEDVRRAMEYVFGGSIICDSSAIAKAIAFDPKIGTKTVTLEGDVYDPSGTLTGGSSAQIGSTLIKLYELSSAEESLKAVEVELHDLQNRLVDAEKKSCAAKLSVEAMQLAKQTLLATEDKIRDSKYAQLLAEQRDLETSIAAFQQEISELKESNQKASSELKSLQSAASTVSNKREKAMKEMENAAKSAQKTVTSLKASMSTLKHAKDVLVAEVEGLEKEGSALADQLQACVKGIAKLSEEVEQLVRVVAEKNRMHAEAKALIEEREEEFSRCSKELRALEASRDGCLKEREEALLAFRRVANELKDFEGRCKDTAKCIADMIKGSPWIATEKEYFGQSGSEYDFEARDMTVAKEKRAAMKKEHDSMSKKVNKKVLTSIDKVEAESNELARKKLVIMNDKKKIEDVISELDLKKTQALETTWVKVNKDFGNIFSTLLPGTTAKLEPLAGCSVMDGLEVKVAFNNVWKDGLTELSGGQRSLLALSLILSMLLFKPAPMYILDEVDAALDLSHTQNIGIMLRAHFSASQFIVVSLKEGMFNNANVIFRTRFVDGISAVTRTVIGGKSRVEAIGNEENRGASESGKAPASKGSKSKSKAKEVVV